MYLQRQLAEGPKKGHIRPRIPMPTIQKKLKLQNTEGVVLAKPTLDTGLAEESWFSLI